MTLQEQKRVHFDEDLDLVSRDEESMNHTSDDVLLQDGGPMQFGPNSVVRVDSETLVKNLEKPFLFITSKNYADKMQSVELDIRGQHTMIQGTILPNFEYEEDEAQARMRLES